jgi:hypothetical protein
VKSPAANFENSGDGDCFENLHNAYGDAFGEAIGDGGTAGAESMKAGNVDIEHTKSIAKQLKRGGSKKTLSGNEKYNTLLDVGKEIAKRVSAEDSETYQKVLTVMKFVLANFQRGGEMALKEATANYMDLQLGNTSTRQNVGSAHQMDTLSNVPRSPPLKRSLGATSCKRKKFSVERDSGPAKANKKVAKGCGLCLQYGHDKSNCSLSNVIGRRLTPGSWASFIMLVLASLNWLSRMSQR